MEEMFAADSAVPLSVLRGLTRHYQPFHYRSLADLIRAIPVKGMEVHELRGVPFT